MRKIDDRGVPISAWHLSLAQQRCGRTIQALRYGHKLPVPFGAGRYEVGVKTSVASTDIASDRAKEFNIDLHIGGVCGYGVAHLPRTDVTMVEFRGMATDKLHGHITNKFNVVATRKLNTVTATGFSPAKVATSSIVDAIAYTITSPNGGNYSSGTLNFPELFNLRTSLATQGYFFNHRYTSRLSVMAAIKQMAQCGRAIPYLPGGTVSIIQDKTHALSTQVFSEEDYDTDSFKMQHIIKTVDSATYVEVSYINPDTWQQEEVTYLEIGGSYETPAKLTLTGCTSRQHAYEIAAYMYKDDNLNRTAIEFTTGLKGHLPAPGDRLRLSVSMLDWGQSGVITSAEAGLVWLSEPVDFKTDSSGILHLTAPTGGVFSLGCHPSAHSHAVAATLLSWVKTAETHGTAATRYLFTPVSTKTLEARFIAARPSGENKIRLFCSAYNALTYDHPGIAPVASFEQGILPLLSSVHYVHLGALSVQISWTGTAFKYRVEVGATIVIDNLNASTFTVTVPAYTGTIKVTPYDAGVLSPANAVQIPFDILAPVTNLQITVNDGITLSATWAAVAGADHYVASILVGGDFLSNQATTTPSVIKQLADISNLPSSFTLRVVSVKGTAQSEPTEIAVNVAAPPMPANFGLISHLTNGFILGWDEVTGASGYTLHRGTTTGFTPTTGNRVALSTILNATVSADVSGAYSHFFRIAAFSSAVGQDDFTNLLFSEIHLTTLVLPAPSFLRVGSTSHPEDGVNNDEGWLTLNWDAVTSAVAYRVKSLVNASDDPKLTGTLLGEVVTLNHTVTGLNFTTLPINFHYAVAAVGSTGDADSDLNWSLLSFSGDMLTGYTNRTKVIIDPINITGDLIDFPVAVVLRNTNFDFAGSLANGHDIRFTAADGVTLLDFERDRHDSVTGRAEYQVKVPAVSSVAPTEIYLYQRTSATVDGANPAAVWGAATKGRWGLGQNPAGGVGAMIDSTINANHGTAHGMTSANSVEGDFSRELSFDGVDDAVDCGNDPSLNMSSFTLEAWFKTTFVNNQIILGKNHTSSYYVNTSGGAMILWTDGGHLLDPNAGVNDGLPQYVAARMDGSARNLFINGIGTVADTGTTTFDTNKLWIGNSDLVPRRFVGTINEARISNIHRSPAWIKASHHSGNNTLLTFT